MPLRALIGYPGRECYPAIEIVARMRGLLASRWGSHAWVSVFCPPFGWIDLDPTNDVHVSSDHITIAWGRDFGDVSPLRGVIVGGGRHRLSVRVSVQAE